MEATPLFGWPYPGKKDPPAGPAQIEGAVKAIEERLAILEKLTGTAKAAVAPAEGQLLVVDGTGHAAYKTMSGDATINSAGVFAIGNEKVTAAKMAKLAVEAQHLANLAVETGKLANSAVTGAKLAALAVTAEKIAAEAVATSKIANLAVTDAKLASPNNAVYRLLLNSHGNLGAEKAAGVTRFFENAQGSLTEAHTVNSFQLIYLAAADYAVDSKATKLRIRAAGATNGIAPGATITPGLYPVTAIAAGAYTIGAVVEGSQAAIVTPNANELKVQAGNDFAFPADGWYALGVINNAKTVAGSLTDVMAQLQVHNV